MNWDLHFLRLYGNKGKISRTRALPCFSADDWWKTEKLLSKKFQKSLQTREQRAKWEEKFPVCDSDTSKGLITSTRENLLPATLFTNIWEPTPKAVIVNVLCLIWAMSSAELADHEEHSKQRFYVRNQGLDSSIHGDVNAGFYVGKEAWQEEADSITNRVEFHEWSLLTRLTEGTINDVMSRIIITVIKLISGTACNLVSA